MRPEWPFWVKVLYVVLCLVGFVAVMGVLTAILKPASHWFAYGLDSALFPGSALLAVATALLIWWMPEIVQRAKRLMTSARR